MGFASKRCDSDFQPKVRYAQCESADGAKIRVGSRTISIETGKLAKQAHGSVIVRSGDTMVLVAASRAANPRDVDFLPLTVDYREYAYAAGRIPGGFFKREGKPPKRKCSPAG